MDGYSTEAGANSVRRGRLGSAAPLNGANNMIPEEIDKDYLKRLTETPSVGTACGPVVSLLTEFFGDGYARTLVQDGFCLFQKAGAKPDKLKAVFVAHMDEIGGCIYGRLPESKSRYRARFWGTADPKLYARARLQAMDYLETSAEPATFEVTAKPYIEDSAMMRKLSVKVDKGCDGSIQAYRTVFTFKQETTYDDDYIYAKAVDPRVTLYAVCEAVRRLDDPAVGALLVMAEECAMDVARKAVTFLSRRAPNLNLVVNSDVPGLANLGDADLDMPAIRIFEGLNFIDPAFGIQTASDLIEAGVAVHLSAARSGSQTLLFSPLAPTLSIALPGENIHTACGKMSLLGTTRCVDLLTAIGERELNRKQA